MEVNITTYERAKRLSETANKLMQEGITPTIVQAQKLIELAIFQELKEELSSIDARLESIDIELSEH